MHENTAQVAIHDVSGWITRREAGRRLGGLSKWTIQRAIDKGLLRFFDQGAGGKRNILVDPESVEEAKRRGGLRQRQPKAK